VLKAPEGGVPDEVREVMRWRAEGQGVAWDGYRLGAMPFVTVATLPALDAPVSALWWAMGSGDVDQPRYVGTGAHFGERTWLAETNPHAVVVDFVALLLLDELVRDTGEGPVDLASRLFARLYVPRSLEPLLDREQTKLSQSQPTQDRSAEQAASVVGMSGKLRLVADMEGVADPSGELAAREYAKAHDLLFVTAYANDHPEVDARAMSVVDFAEFLRRTGRCDRAAVDFLASMPRPRIPGPGPDRTHLESARAVVIDGIALMQLAQAGALAAFVEWSRDIHVTARDWARLNDRRRGAEIHRDYRERFERLWDSLRTNGAVHWVDLKRDERHVHLDEEDGPDGERTVDPTWDSAFAYVSDLYNVAMAKSAPLWTDDRATRAVALPDVGIPRFGTDSGLWWAHRSGQLHEQEWLALMDRLVRPCNLSLAIDADYLLALLRQGGTRE